MRPLFIAIISAQHEEFDKTKELLENKYFDFTYFDDLKSLLKDMEEKEFDIVVIDDKNFTKNINDPSIDKLIIDDNVLLYSGNDSYQNKKEFFIKGGWMSAVGQLANERFLFFLNQMLQFENQIIPTIRKKNLFVGDMINFSLKELLISAFMENKSFEIFVISEHQYGKVFIQNGTLMGASWGKSKDIEALVRMFFLNNGKIRVVPPRRNFDMANTMPTLMGVIHEYEFQKQMFNEWLQKNSKLTINNTKITWKEKSTYVFNSHDEKILVEKLSSGLSIEAVISLVDLMPLKTLEILHHFEDAGNITFSAIEGVADDQAGILQITNKEVFIKEKFKLSEDAKSARLLVFGHISSGKIQFVSMLEGKGIQKKSVRNLESLRIEINDKFNLNVLGLSLESDIMPAIEMIGDKMDAFIFFIDATQPDNFEYINYLINLILNNYQLPSVFVLSNTQHLDEDAIELIKTKFKFKKEVKFISINIEKLNDPWYLINEIEFIEEKSEESNKKNL